MLRIKRLWFRYKTRSLLLCQVQKVILISSWRTSHWSTSFPTLKEPVRKLTRESRSQSRLKNKSIRPERATDLWPTEHLCYFFVSSTSHWSILCISIRFSGLWGYSCWQSKQVHPPTCSSSVFRPWTATSLTRSMKTFAEVFSKNTNFYSRSCLPSRSSRETIKLIISSGDIFFLVLLERLLCHLTQLTGFLTISGLIFTGSSMGLDSSMPSKISRNIWWLIQTNGENFSIALRLKTRTSLSPTSLN